MRKSIAAIFFTSFFMMTIITPSIVLLFDLDHSIYIIVDSSEEEEKEGKEGKESAKDKDVKIFQIFNSDLDFFSNYLTLNSGLYSNTYTSNYLELISPPPEFS